MWLQLAIFGAMLVMKPSQHPCRMPTLSLRTPASLPSAPLPARMFLLEIYKNFSREPHRQAGRTHPNISAKGPWERASSYFTRNTLATIRAHQAQLTEIGIVDGDPFCDCQDWADIKVDAVRIKTVSKTRVDAIVIFYDVGRMRKKISYRLVYTDDGWRVDDMTLLGSSPDGWLVAVLKAETIELQRRSMANQN